MINVTTHIPRQCFSDILRLTGVLGPMYHWEASGKETASIRPVLLGKIQVV